MSTEPKEVKIRMYNVGFGDCFLLSFYYKPHLPDRHILIDFGSVGGKADLPSVAKQIKADCGGELYAVVATHRHRDHISGFNNAGGDDSPGGIIRSLKPRMVLQPWTENPKAGADAKTTPLLAGKPGKPLRIFYASMNAMQAYADQVATMAPRWRGAGGRMIGLERLAANNTKNPEAVKNLRTMSEQPRYLQWGSPSGLESPTLLPGVKVHVLGPPNLNQQNLKKYAGKSDEYWLASKYWGLQERAAATASSADLFPHAPRVRGAKPFQTRWFIDRADMALKNNALAIVTMLDSFLNNTSLILLFEVKGKKLLFPGDAQWENWQWALSQPGTKELLKDVDVYKVGHHGSRNATPKDLWNLFDKKKQRELKTMMSTASGVYGKTAESAVPSANLVKALKSESTLNNTQDLKGAKKPIEVTI